MLFRVTISISDIAAFVLGLDLLYIVCPTNWLTSPDNLSTNTTSLLTNSASEGFNKNFSRSIIDGVTPNKTL